MLPFLGALLDLVQPGNAFRYLPCVILRWAKHGVFIESAGVGGVEAVMADRKIAVLAALRALITEGDLLERHDWRSVSREALSGSAPAQYIVATGFEELGDDTQAQEWYQLSAAQGYLPAMSKLTGQSSVPLPDASALPMRVGNDR
jgi:hypothetical protein